MRRVLVRLFVMILLACVAAGCGLPRSKDWTHPRIADPRREDKQFEVDSAFCEEKAAGAQSHDAAMDECLRRLGWQRKE